ncbi:VOC family protein [Spongisporangium articulatum]|uniref:VOC family protein n=1 Tax=Spongisporangium articulatum TaxID=3362603 RepID=A0ABW8AQV7_9ACTN
MSTLNPYLGFRDNAREAIEFYQSVFGGELTVNTFGDFGMPVDEAESGKVMHSQLETPSGFTLMASDRPNYMELPEASNIAVSLSGPASDEAELAGYFEKLSEGGTVAVPLAKAPWGDQFGSVTDRFGIEWMVNIAGS